VRKLWVQINWHFNFLRNDALRFTAAACFVVVHLLDCRTCLGVLLLCDIAQKVVENLVNILARLGRCLDVLYFPLSCTSFCFFQWNLQIFLILFVDFTIRRTCLFSSRSTLLPTRMNGMESVLLSTPLTRKICSRNSWVASKDSFSVMENTQRKPSPDRK
jgi:hypothetical protein